MTVGELKEILEDYNDYEPVNIKLIATEYGKAQLVIGEHENVHLVVEN